MISLVKGQFFGDTGHTLAFDGITLTDTVYTHPRVDWHFHEQAYFTFILQGAVIEGDRREEYECPAGTLLFHHWQEPHYNSKPPGFTRGFHIEIERSWIDGMDQGKLPEGSSRIGDPAPKTIVRQLFREMKSGTTSIAATESLVTGLLGNMVTADQQRFTTVPRWVKKARELFHDTDTMDLGLAEIAAFVQVHPVHFSRGFAKYFGCTLGEYQRMVRVEKSANLMTDYSRSLTDIGYECGFADQSHFTRCFRKVYGHTPKAFRALLTR
ncbi:MAG: AraC family transcriptional regulator [Chitinophagaceae bacterium]|nr:MAG: AraC family transcriptional regulator [Chitinophagaceae bacterium]